MAQREHQKYWFMVMGGSGLLGIGLISAAATVGTSAGRLDDTGPLAILAYIAFACVAVFFVCGIRQLRFPLAKVEIETPPQPPPPPPPPEERPGPGPGPSVKDVKDALKALAESLKKAESDN